MKNTLKHFDEFITSVKHDINDDIKFEYEYDGNENMHYIWHNYTNFNELPFKKVIGKYARIYFLDNDIFNITIAYKKDTLNEIKFMVITQKSYKTDYRTNIDINYQSHQFDTNNLQYRNQYEINCISYIYGVESREEYAA